MELGLKEKNLKILEQMKPIDDIFFEVLANDVAFCQEILRVILEDDKLIVEEVRVQEDVKNLTGRSVRLDVLCILGDQTRCNIELQRANEDNHFKRIRYNAASITVSTTQTGTRFEDIPSVIVVYISEFDILKKGKTTYHIDKVVRETGDVIDDGVKVVCVNTKINDGSRIAELMQLFTKTEVNEVKFPVFTERMNHIKHSEGGQRQMSNLMELYYHEELEEGRRKSRQEGRQEGKQEVIQGMLLQNISTDIIAQCANTDIEYILKIKSDMIKNGQL